VVVRPWQEVAPSLPLAEESKSKPLAAMLPLVAETVLPLDLVLPPQRHLK
jgi:hypothetical protein